MNRDFKSTWHKIQNPPVLIKALVFILTVLSAGGSIAIAVIGFEGSSLEILAYVLFALAGTSLTYSVVILIPIVPHLKGNIVSLLERHAFTKKLLKSFGFRTLVFATGSFALSIVIASFNAYMGVMNRSVWYGALAGYYIALALLRGSVLAHHHGSAKRDTNSHHGDAKMFLRSGIILLVLNVALSAAIAETIFSSAHFTYVGLTIFAYAAYAFYKITISIVNLVRKRRDTDLTLRAVLLINATDAATSIMALQTALLTSFADGSLDVSMMNTFTGIAVSAFCITIAVYMIASAKKKLKNLPKESL